MWSLGGRPGLATGRILCSIWAGATVVASGLVVARGWSGSARFVATFARRWCRTRGGGGRRGRGLAVDGREGLAVDAPSAAASATTPPAAPSSIAHGAFLGRAGGIL